MRIFQNLPKPTIYSIALCVLPVPEGPHETLHQRLSAEFPSPSKQVIHSPVPSRQKLHDTFYTHTHTHTHIYMLYFLLCIYVTHHLSLFVFVDRKLRANTTILSKNFFKLQDNFFNAKSRRSLKSKTDIQGALLSGVQTEQPTNLAPPYLPPSLVTSKSPLRTLQVERVSLTRPRKYILQKKRLIHLTVLNQFLYFFLKDILNEVQ